MLEVTASFPESNPFGRTSLCRDVSLLRYSGQAWHIDVINGEVNQLFLTIENKTGKNVTLHSVAGEFYDPATEQLIKAVRVLPRPCGIS